MVDVDGEGCEMVDVDGKIVGWEAVDCEVLARDAAGLISVDKAGTRSTGAGAAGCSRLVDVC